MILHFCSGICWGCIWWACLDGFGSWYILSRLHRSRKSYTNSETVIKKQITNKCQESMTSKNLRTLMNPGLDWHREMFEIIQGHRIVAQALDCFSSFCVDMKTAVTKCVCIQAESNLRTTGNLAYMLYK